MKHDDVRTIDDRTKLKVSIGIGLGIMASIFATGWGAARYVDGFEAKVDAHFTALQVRDDQIVASLGSKVSMEELSSWSHEMDSDNRSVQRTDGKTGLIIPEPTSLGRLSP